MLDLGLTQAMHRWTRTLKFDPCAANLMLPYIKWITSVRSDEFGPSDLGILQPPPICSPLQRRVLLLLGPLLPASKEKEREERADAKMVQRLTYRKRHSYATKSNQTRVVKTPGEDRILSPSLLVVGVSDLFLGLPRSSIASFFIYLCSDSVLIGFFLNLVCFGR